MQQFTGTKVILATPMTRADYNKYRGWKLPSDEDGTDEGMLVEYTDGGQPNHLDHTGYISWSPTDVFNISYSPSGTHVEHMVIERDELAVKVTALGNFMHADIFKSLHPDKRHMVVLQHDAMRTYLDVLTERLSREEVEATK